METVIIILIAIAIAGKASEGAGGFIGSSKSKTWAEQYEERMIREGKWKPND